MIMSMLHPKEFWTNSLKQTFLLDVWLGCDAVCRWSDCIGYRIEIVYQIGTLSTILQHFTYNEIQWPIAASRWHFALQEGKVASGVTILLAMKRSRPPDLKSSSNVSLPFSWNTGPHKRTKLVVYNYKSNLSYNKSVSLFWNSLDFLRITIVSHNIKLHRADTRSKIGKTTVLPGFCGIERSSSSRKGMPVIQLLL